MIEGGFLASKDSVWLVVGAYSIGYSFTFGI